MKIFAQPLDHPEGLAFDSEGTLWAGGEAGQLYRITAGASEKIADLGGFCLGITLSAAQDIFVCNAGLRSLQQVARDGRVLRSVERVGDRPLRNPNFSVFDRAGNLYFTDSGEWGGKDGCVYRMRSSGKLEYFAGPFRFANGLALSDQEDALFVVESQGDCVLRVEIRPDGAAGEQQVYASGLARVPDGLAFDRQGNLYVTCYATDCIYRVSPGGMVELFAFDPEGTMLARPTNAAFGGPDGSSLYVANLGRWHITEIPTSTRGQRLAGQGAAQ